MARRFVDEQDAHWHVRVDAQTCIGSGSCAFAAPELFDVDDDGTAYVLDGPPQPLATARPAVSGCPTSALHLVRDET